MVSILYHRRKIMSNKSITKGVTYPLKRDKVNNLSKVSRVCQVGKLGKLGKVSKHFFPTLPTLLTLPHSHPPTFCYILLENRNFMCKSIIPPEILQTQEVNGCVSISRNFLRP